MDSKLKKLKRLTNAIKGIKPLGVFSLVNGQWHHMGEAISIEEKNKIAAGYEKVIEIETTIIGAEPAKSQQPKTLR